MEHKLFNESENEISKNLKTFENLVTNCAKLGISIIEIPLVDSSSLKTNNGKIQFKNNLEKMDFFKHVNINSNNSKSSVASLVLQHYNKVN